MAMASMSMALNRPLAPLQGQQPSLQSRKTRRAAAPAISISCSSASPSKRNQQCAPPGNLEMRIGGVLVPFFTAAALIGSTPNLVEAVFGPPPAIAAEADTVDLDAYKELLQKIKEKRGRQGFKPPTPAPAPAPAAVAPAPAPAPEVAVQPEQPSFSSAASRVKEAAEKRIKETTEKVRLEREAEETRASAKRETEKRETEKREAEEREAEKQAEARRAQESAALAERERAAIEKVAREKKTVASVTVKTKTHGFLPLFVSQFFLLLATLGLGAVLFVLPEKQRKEIKDKLDEFVDKATPVAEDAYAKAKPYAEKAWEKAQEAGVAAKPYAEKAWEQAKPMAAKAVEASKPFLKEAQVKANELLEEAQKRTK